MNSVTVYSREKKIRHLVDASKYSRVSQSQSLCGLTGDSYWKPNAVYFWGEKWPLCKRCAAVNNAIPGMPTRKHKHENTNKPRCVNRYDYAQDPRANRLQELLVVLR